MVKFYKNSVLAVSLTVFTFIFVFFAIFFLDDFNRNSNYTLETVPKQKSFYTSAEEVKVPNFVDVDINTAKKLVKTTTSFRVLVSQKVYDDAIKKDHIISQEPAAEAMCANDAVISVVLSLGPKTKALPNIENLKLAEAAKMLAQEGFVPQKVDSFSDTVAYGRVVGYKSHAPDDIVNVGNTVKFVVSKGKKTIAKK